MSEPRKRTPAEILAAAKARLLASRSATPSRATRKNNNNGSARAASPARSTSSRASSAPRGRSLSAMRERLHEQAALLRQTEAALASSKSNLSLLPKAAARSIQNNVESLQRKVVELERSHKEKLNALEAYKEKRAPSRERRARLAESISGNARWARPGYRTSTAKRANNNVEQINKEIKRMEREAAHEAIVLRNTRLKLEKTDKKIVASMAKPAASAASAASSRKKKTANELEAELANLNRRLSVKANRNRAAAARREEAEDRKIVAAYQKLREFDADILEEFCRDLIAGKRSPSRSMAAARAARDNNA